MPISWNNILNIIVGISVVYVTNKKGYLLRVPLGEHSKYTIFLTFFCCFSLLFFSFDLGRSVGLPGSLKKIGSSIRRLIKNKCLFSRTSKEMTKWLFNQLKDIFNQSNETRKSYEKIVHTKKNIRRTPPLNKLFQGLYKKKV